MATPPGEACPTLHPWHREDSLTHPLRQRDGAYPTQREPDPTGESTGLPHSDIPSMSRHISDAPGTKPGPGTEEKYVICGGAHSYRAHLPGEPDK